MMTPTDAHDLQESITASQQGLCPGESLFQDEFFICSVKDFGLMPGLGHISVQIAIDASCDLMFAKVFSSRNSMNAVDLLRTRVFPFYEHYGVAVQRVFTPDTAKFHGLAPVHPFETLLATSHIEHLFIAEASEAHQSACGRFYPVLIVLIEEFFKPTLRRRYHRSIGALQNELDAFVREYNYERRCFGCGLEGRTRFGAFLHLIGALKHSYALR